MTSHLKKYYNYYLNTSIKQSILINTNFEILINFIVNLSNYVAEVLIFTSVLSRHGSFTIFLLLNDLSHDFHFSTRQNMEPENFSEKKSNFSLHGFPRYLTPNMALQKIILTSFFSLFLFFPIEGYAFFVP